ncbi:MAG: RNA-protein complex protein Nop10 [Candidatus Thermoplasmatota archaeon]|nr:RNA-protein complex protein Nop10 [Candidatus Thermoplasmatota archaeon]
MTLLQYCTTCNEYTLYAICPRCQGKTIRRHPPRFSPQDNYGKYRRMLKKEQKRE